ncbi:Small subunit processome component [Rhizophlyctis rosea]|uniref:U three protein 23 n=1 Tax=Rhizophlyctis rosea TaxID=64517 RepID=A0AAD5SA25_9FUNG|nr:Small subunit processome component [Rhizophlyctis rosea]
MKVKRQKTNKRIMSTYTNSFGFREPFQVLVDGNFIQVSLMMRNDLYDVFPKTMMGQAKPMTTSCVYAELRKLGSDFSGAAINAKRFEKRRCTHTPAISAADCLREIIGPTNKFNYCVATQDIELRSQLRKIPGTPLIYINKGVTILEPPSRETLQAIKDMEVAKTKPQSFEVSVLKKPETEEEPVKKKKKVKGPNPLSVKKKKHETKPKKSKKSMDEENGEGRMEGSEDVGKAGGASIGEAETGESADAVDGAAPSVGAESSVGRGQKRAREEEEGGNDEDAQVDGSVGAGGASESATAGQKKKRKRRKKTKSKNDAASAAVDGGSDSDE